MITHARFTEPDHSMITANIDGVPASFPPDLENRHYAEIVAADIDVAPYLMPAPTADDVRREASRRMQSLVGARDAAHLEIIIANGTREAVRLLRKGEGNWTPEEAARSAQLQSFDAAIEAIRAASNLLEPSPPYDYTANRHWPSFE